MGIAPVAVISGGSVGIGLAIARALVKEAVHVVICARNEARTIEEAAKISNEYRVKALAIEADVSKYEQVQAMFKQVEETLGGLDILVNNAGIAPRSALIDQIDIGEWHRVINVNLHGVFYCMKEGLRIMVKQKKGSVINIASILGLCGMDPDVMAQAPYTAAKSGVIGLTRQAAAEYGGYGIRVNCIAPGFHHGTRLPESLGMRPNEEESKTRQQMIASRNPLGRTGAPKELKGLLLYLASDSSSFMTGEVIVHDGGWTIW